MNLDDAVQKGLETAHPPLLRRVRIEKGNDTSGSFIENVEGLIDGFTLVFYGEHSARRPYHGTLCIPFRDEEVDFMTFADLAMQLYNMDCSHPTDLSPRAFRAARQTGMHMFITPHNRFSTLAVNTTYEPPATVLDDLPYCSTAQHHPLLRRLLRPYYIHQHMKRVRNPTPHIEALQRQKEHIARCSTEHPGELAASKHEFNQMFRRTYRDAACAQYLPGFVVYHASTKPEELLHLFSTLAHDSRLLTSGILESTSPHDSTKRLVYAQH